VRVNLAGWLTFLGMLGAVVLVVAAAIIGDMRFALVALIVLCLVIASLVFLIGPNIGTTDK
jgi:hypothetical protein